jgi:DNA-binding CsgD family transcriptional regulator
LLTRGKEDRRELEEKILSNVKELVAPYIDKLKKCRLDTKPMTYLRILESNLNDIVSPFVHQLSLKYSALTPKEIEVAQLIREDKKTREIAQLLSLSKRTIESHRQNIRNKLGIKDTKANLRSYLFSM